MYPPHTVRVRTLYRNGLKTLLNWTVHRDLWISEGLKLRAEFDACRALTSPPMIEKVLTAGEAKLEEYAHPAPYRIPTDPGGTKYQRYARNSTGFAPEAAPSRPTSSEAAYFFRRGRGGGAEARRDLPLSRVARLPASPRGAGCGREHVRLAASARTPR
eukprot:CAMPEP_0206153008 /NCGR_PEP_ID=MMETSP1474-20131121/298_1 /ASSEMBLY_ACC=CAM_ASM_001110 /TAXON_ID=97495 /ORGANISM="Imantonia sp., Strain RCC918" /LENGTH=158 /DNA_ID=CAMNT_0053550667 /DNA_START=45 /DNA_END=522 /DNA_ORIENTATION=-